MIYLKGFSDLFEAIDRSISYTSDEIKQMPEYQDLLDSCNLKDTSSPTIAKAGNIRFQENDSEQTYTIFSNGYIRYQWIGKESPWYGGMPRRGTPGVYVSPIGEKLNDIIYGRPVTTKEDYIVKFEYLKRLIFKKRGNPLPPISPDVIAKRIDNAIEKDPGVVKNPAVEKLIKKGIYKPNDYSSTVMDATEFGLI